MELVERRGMFSLAGLKQYPSRTQVTEHICEEGWSAIGEWTGVQLSYVLNEAGVQPGAKYVVFYCVDGAWGSLDMEDAWHPQTLLAYGMNGEDLQVPHGAPVRLRVERQLGYKSLKYIAAHFRDGHGEGYRQGDGWLRPGSRLFLVCRHLAFR